MPRLLKVSVLCAGISLSSPLQARPVDLLIQMSNYDGEAAYLAVYLVDAEGRYDQTLWVAGTDSEYYEDMTRWWRYLSRQPQELDAITGASAGSGARTVVRLDLDDALFDSGHVIRVESAVEDQDNFAEDAQIGLTTATDGERSPGTGYVRNLRLSF